MVGACGARSELEVGGRSAEPGAGGEGGKGPPVERASAVDLLLVIDNSGSMVDKQELLGLAVPDLIAGLVDPPCLNAAGVTIPNQPTGQQPCPAGSSRRFGPVKDMHVGIISSSLGGHGADACGPQQLFANDFGHLIARDINTNTVPTYGALGFLAWDPLQQLSPPGETNLTALATRLQSMVLGAGQTGCGYEAPMEAWYRFLVEPDPHVSISVQAGAAVLSGTDEVVLQQRRDFLRPNTLLMVVTLSDENDCSIRDGGNFFFAAQILDPISNEEYHLPPARAACATDPNDSCCLSCGQAPGAGCSTAQDTCAPLDALSDHINLRCWDQKRRFGLDFLYPIDRYVAGLQAAEVPDRFGNVVPNPIFSDLNPADGEDVVRTPALVLYAGLVGVPWQDVARRNAAGEPDLIAGLDADGEADGGFQSPAELVANGTWQLVLGEPDDYHTDPDALPSDALMIESPEPRSGVHPILGVALAPPGAGYLANPINGHEVSIPLRDDLQYACLFPLAQPRDCTDPEQIGCGCVAGNDDPLCQAADGSFTTTQTFASAYPGVRHLQLLRALGAQAVLGSICPAQLNNPATLDFGYRPVVAALLERSASFLEQ